MLGKICPQYWVISPQTSMKMHDPPTLSEKIAHSTVYLHPSDC